MAVQVPALAGEDAAAAITAPIAALVDAHPTILEHAEYGCDDDDIAELEVALGHALPGELEELLRMSDGGTLNAAPHSMQLVSSSDMAAWAEQGLMQELEAVPFARDDSGTLLLCDSEGAWGGEKGGIFRVVFKRWVRGKPLGDAHKVANSLAELFEHVAAGRRAW
ncbi:MAG: hypothetical protein ACI9WU_000675 [Myxococcota bacterium]